MNGFQSLAGALVAVALTLSAADVSASAAEPIERHTIPCSLARPDAVRRVVDALARNGWEITYTQPDLGIVSARLFPEYGEPYWLTVVADGAALNCHLARHDVALQSWGDVQANVRDALLAFLTRAVSA